MSLTEQPVGVSIEGLQHLTQEQQRLFRAFAEADHLHAQNGDAVAAVRREEAETQLIALGIYPCYDDEDKVYTYLFG